MKEIYKVVEVKGLNLDRFINILNKRGIVLKNLKKVDKKTLNVMVKYNQFEKFFAISTELCYNVKVIKVKGRSYPLFYLKRNLGLLVGVIIFLVTALLSNDLVLDIEYSGSGSVLKREVQSYLDSRGVTSYTRFSSLELGKLSSDILSSNSGLSFVSCVKEGNTLKVDLQLAKNQTDVISGKASSLFSDRDGVVEEIKVYRGSACVNVGEKVVNGQMLVSDEVTIKEQTTKVNVLATVTIISSYSYEYYSEDSEKEEEAIAYFEENFNGDGEIIQTVVSTSKVEQGYKYLVTLNCRKTLFTG